MIYLIESGNFYKIGFTENLKSRMNNMLLTIQIVNL